MRTRLGDHRALRACVATVVVFAAPLAAEDAGIILLTRRVAVFENGSLNLESAQGGMSGFTVTRQGGSSGQVTVDLGTFDGSAIAGQDYVELALTLTWENGEDGAKEVPLFEIVDDAEVEGSEWFGVRLSNSSGGARLPTTVGRVVIRDDDVAVDSPSRLADVAGNPDSAVDDQGNRLVAFEAPDADGLGIYALLLSPNGEPLKGPDLVNISQLGDQHSPTVAFAGDGLGSSHTGRSIGGFSVFWIDGPATPSLERESIDYRAAAEARGATVRRRFFGSDGGLADTTEELQWDLSGDFWGVVAGPGGRMAAFGCNADGFAVGYIVGPPGEAILFPAGQAIVLWVSEAPIPGCTPSGGAGAAGRATAAMEAPRPRLGAVPKRSFGPITVAYSLSGATQEGAGAAGWAAAATANPGLRARSFSWAGEPLGVEIHVTASATAANPAVTTSARGGISLFWDDIGEQGDRDVFGLLAPDPQSLGATGTRRIHLEHGGDQSLAGVAANRNGESFLALQNGGAEGIRSSASASASATASVTVPLFGLLLDEDGSRAAAPIPLGQAVAEERLTVTLDDRDRGLVTYLNAQGELVRRRFQASIGRGACQPDDNTLCLADQRYAVTALWSTPASESGPGRSRALTADTGTFWFFDADNLEVLLKVLDACAVNGRFWVFAAGLTHVGVSLLVDDTQTGLSRVFTDAVGEVFQPIQDTSAFDTCDPAAARIAFDEEPAASAPTRWPGSAPGQQPLGGACAEGTLCLGDRFEVSLEWETPQGQIGSGQPVQLTTDSGTFWFFDENNVEVLVKVLDACHLNDRQWLFAAGLTHVGATITVRDTATGELRTYGSPPGQPFQPIVDLDAFAGCSM